MENNYTLIHLHSDYSLLDSTTKFERYVDWAVENGMQAIATTEHGVLYNWTTKKEYCDKAAIKYIHGVELYMTSRLYHTRKKLTENKDKTFKIEDVSQKYRDNYHIILLAKNYNGLKEINQLVSIANDSDHFYFKPRITVDEFLQSSDNIISTSACLAGFIWSYNRTIDSLQLEIESTMKENEQYLQQKEQLIVELNSDAPIRKKKRSQDVIQKEIDLCDAYVSTNEYNIKRILEDIALLKEQYGLLLQKYTYYEVQPHVNSQDQKDLNSLLVDLSVMYDKPLVCGTDTHSYDSYVAECRTIMQIAKGIEFLEEDTFDLTLKTYDELVDLFKQQGVLNDEQIYKALENTNVIADSCETFELDKSFKYPIFKSPEEDAKKYEQDCWNGLENKIKIGAIDVSKKQEYVDRVSNELRVFNKLNMNGFMLSMKTFVGNLRAQGIPFGFSRGSCFTKDNFVTCIDRKKPIDKVQTGDLVLSHDSKYHKVVYTKTEQTDILVEVQYAGNNDMIKCTPDHLFLVREGSTLSWKRADVLKLGDELCTPHNDTWEYHKVISLKNYNVPSTTVYDLTVEDTHTYIVNDVIVHNCGGSLCAYVTDITDCDPIVWDLIFERFCNENRVSLPD